MSKIDSRPCPACASPSLEYDPEGTGNGCEWCGFDKDPDLADCEDERLQELRRIRGRYCFPYLGDSPAFLAGLVAKASTYAGVLGVTVMHGEDHDIHLEGAA